MKPNRTTIPGIILALLVLGACGESQTGTAGKHFNEPQPLVTPPPPIFTDILFFATDSIHLGNMGGRAGVDQKCDDEKPAEADGRQVRAFISVEVGDGIVDMPNNYDIPMNVPVVSVLGIELAMDWSDLTDTTIATPLSAALPNMPTNTYYWTGTMPNGSVSMTCNGWTGTSGGADAGSSEEINGQWLSSVGSVCSFGRKILCVAY